MRETIKKIQTIIPDAKIVITIENGDQILVEIEGTAIPIKYRITEDGEDMMFRLPRLLQNDIFRKVTSAKNIAFLKGLKK